MGFVLTEWAGWTKQVLRWRHHMTGWCIEPIENVTGGQGWCVFKPNREIVRWTAPHLKGEPVSFPTDEAARQWVERNAAIHGFPLVVAQDPWSNVGVREDVWQRVDGWNVFHAFDPTGRHTGTWWTIRAPVTYQTQDLPQLFATAAEARSWVDAQVPLAPEQHGPDAVVLAELLPLLDWVDR